MIRGHGDYSRKCRVTAAGAVVIRLARLDGEVIVRSHHSGHGLFS